VVVVVVVVLVVEVLVVVVAGGRVVVVGGRVVVVVVVAAPGGADVVVGADAVGGGAGNDQRAAAQSVGVEATTTSTPGSVEMDHTTSGGPVCRQPRAGSKVAKLERVPTGCAVLPGAGAAIGVRRTFGVPS